MIVRLFANTFYKQLCFLAWLMFILPGYNSVSYAQDVNDYAWVHYTNENGLPQNSVKQIVPDNYGFLWMPTEAGLIRFDGRDFKLYNKRNTGVLSSRMADIKRGVDNKLYAISETWDLLAIDNGTVHLSDRSTSKVFGLIYDARPTNSVQHRSWNSENWRWPENFIGDSLQINTSDTTAVLLTGSNKIGWIKNGIITKFTPGYAPADFFRYFTIGQDLYFLPDPAKGLVAWKVQPHGNTAIRFTGDILKEKNLAEIMLCLNTANNTVFLYTDLHFYIVTREEDGSLGTKLLLRGFNFKDQQIHAAYYDSKNERLFLGSTFNGLYVLSKRKFFSKSYDKEVSTNKNVFYEQIVFNDSTILSGKGVLLSSGNIPPSLLPNISVTSNMYGNVIMRAKDNSIWTADHKYLYQHSADARKVLRKIETDLAYSICESENGTLWLGTKKRGLFTLNPKEPQAIPKLFLATNEYIICLAEERKGILWAGTERYLFRIDTRTKRVDTIQELKSKTVRALYIPTNNEVWICTYEDGMYLYRDGRITHFPLDKMGYLNMVHKILCDDNGFFWLSSNNGLFQVKKEDLLHYAAKGGDVPFYLHYSKSAGFNTNEFNGGSNNVGVKLPNGYFTFSSMNGVVFFKPAAITPDLPIEPILIDAVDVDGLVMPIVDTTIVLQRKPTRISFTVASAYFGETNNLLIEYSIATNESSGSNWIRIDNNFVSFGNLPVGRHTVLFRKRAGFGVGNYVYKKVVVVIPPSWWETIWFRAGIAAITVLLIWLLIYLRVRYLRKRNKTLEAAVQERTIDLLHSIEALEQSETKLGKQLNFQKKLNESIAHDIHTPLKYLALSSRMLLEKARQNEPATIEEMESIATSSERIYKFVKSLLDYLKAYISDGGIVNRSSMNLHALIDSILPIFEQSARESNNVFVNEAAPGIIINSHPQLLKTVLHNIIDNALKYTVDGTIAINTIQAEDELSIVISDTGFGMTNESIEKYQRFFRSPESGSPDIYTGFGFIIIKDIIQILGGRIHIRSQQGVGTVFTVSLKT